MTRCELDGVRQQVRVDLFQLESIGQDVVVIYIVTVEGYIESVVHESLIENHVQSMTQLGYRCFTRLKLLSAVFQIRYVKDVADELFYLSPGRPELAQTVVYLAWIA